MPDEKFPWSDAQIRKAMAPRAVPTEEELKVLRDLALEGAVHIMARRAGGRKRRNPAVLGDLRRIRLIQIYVNLPPHLRRFPTGTNTIKRLRDVLAKDFNINVNEDTIRKDVRKIRTQTLRDE